MSAKIKSPHETNEQRNSDKCDAIIVGGGMVGLVAALALDKADMNVVVVESTAPKKSWPKGFDPRVSAITRASQNVFSALGA